MKKLLMYPFLALMLIVTCQSAVFAEDKADVDKLLQLLRKDASQEQLDYMMSFARSKDAPSAIPKLLDVLRKEAPMMDNNICLAIEFILSSHPDADCPIEPLLDVISRKEWTSQQKGAQVLYYALKADKIKGNEQKLYKLLIPLLTSQRSRVYNAALRCLHKISGQKIGPDPDKWKSFYEKEYKDKLDLTKAVFEIVAVIKPIGKVPSMKYSVNGSTALDAEKLKSELRSLSEQAVKNKLVIGAVFQIPDKDMENIFKSKDSSMIQEAINCVVGAGLMHFTISPESDVFRPPYIKLK